jgi:hypothetical protein
MKVGPLDFPVSNAMQMLGFVILVCASVLLLRAAPIPARFKP